MPIKKAQENAWPTSNRSPNGPPFSESAMYGPPAASSSRGKSSSPRKLTDDLADGLNSVLSSRKGSYMRSHPGYVKHLIELFGDTGLEMTPEETDMASQKIAKLHDGIGGLGFTSIRDALNEVVAGRNLRSSAPALELGPEVTQKAQTDKTRARSFNQVMGKKKTDRRQ